MAIDFYSIEKGFIPDDLGKSSISEKGMVSTATPEATEAGVEMLRQNGNAVDAAIASALALCVSEPQACGLGGQTMMLIGLENQVIAVDGSSRAPSLAHVNAVYKEDRSLGYRASTVPSTLATLWYVQNRYGQLKWEQILEPAIAIATHGYNISILQSKLQKREEESFNKIPSRSGNKYFLNNNKGHEPGALFKQQELSELLKRIALKGINDFYKGKVAKQIDADMRENGGLLRYDDLALIPYPIVREPLKRPFRSLDVYTMPPPGSGRTLLFALMMLDLIPPELYISDDATRHFLLIKILRKALLERSDRPYDPNFFAQVADDTSMLDQSFSRECLNTILKEVDKTIIPLIPSFDETSGETTHLSVIDQNGMAVSLTQSIERVYGSKAAAEGLGFLYNNYLYDYEYNMPDHPFYLRPNKAPWATVTPTMIFNDKNIWMALGSPGSERIISVLVQFLLLVIDRKYPIDKAMKMPRFHCSLGGRVSLEVDGFAESLVPFLKHKGFRIDERPMNAFYMGCLQAVLRKHDGSGFQGIADVRRDGTAKGI